MVVLQEIQIGGPMTLHFPSWMSNSAHLEKGKKVWNNFVLKYVHGCKANFCWGWGVKHLPENFCKLPKFLWNNWRETIGSHDALTQAYIRSENSLAYESIIDQFHTWQPINYSFVNVRIRPTCLVLKEHFFCIFSVQMRLVGIISRKTIEYLFWPLSMQSVFMSS